MCECSSGKIITFPLGKKNPTTCDSVVRQQFWEGLSPVLSGQASIHVCVPGPRVPAGQVAGPPFSRALSWAQVSRRPLSQQSRWWGSGVGAGCPAPEAGLPWRVRVVTVNLGHCMSVAV